MSTMLQVLTLLILMEKWQIPRHTGSDPELNYSWLKPDVGLNPTPYLRSQNLSGWTLFTVYRPTSISARAVEWASDVHEFIV